MTSWVTENSWQYSPKPFTNKQVLLTLYNSLIRSWFDYCSSVWSPNAQYLVDKLEHVQRKFVKYLCFHFDIYYESSSYEHMCSEFHLTTLQWRWKTTVLVCCHKFFKYYVNCPNIVSNIFFDLAYLKERQAIVVFLWHRISADSTSTKTAIFLV